MKFRVSAVSSARWGDATADRQRHEYLLAAWTGNHPYLSCYSIIGTRGHAVAAGRCRWEPFVRRLAAEIGEDPERRLLCYLIERGKPVNPIQAQSDTGIQDIKAVADTLIYLGVISRWIRNEEATLFAGCRLLNNYIAAV